MTTRRPRSRSLAAAALVVVAAACSDGDSETAPSTPAATAATPASTTAPAPSTSALAETITSAVEAATTEAEATTTATDETTSTDDTASTDDTTTTEETAASTTEATSTTAGATVAWVMQDAPEDCMCADGSPFEFWSRLDDPERVVLYFQGGGACFSAGSCSFTNGSYKPTVAPGDDPSDSDGIFDFENPANPFDGWSAVFVPYCTGDVHLGDTTTEYSPELTIEHKGYVNAEAALDYLVETFPDAAEVFVTGSSAGGIPSPLFGGLVADRLPQAEVAVLADASGGYQSVPGINSAIGSLWGTVNNIPDWPETAGITPEQYGVPDLFVFAGRHIPEIRFARYDNAWDEVQRSFGDATGMGDDPLPDVLDRNEQLVESAGIDLSTYVAPGDEHTILLRPDLYELDVEGVALIDWLTRFVEGETPGDVECVDCETPADAEPSTSDSAEPMTTAG